MENNFLPIERQTVTIETIKPFDVFYSDYGKMKMYAAGGELLHEGVDDSEAASSEQFYIMKKDLAYYQLYIEEVLGLILEKDTIDHTIRSKTAYSTITNLAKILYLNPDEKIIRRYRQIIIDTVQYVMNSEHALSHLINLTNFEFSLHNHSVNVGIFSVGLAKEIFKDRSKHNFEELGVAFFLHDIGKTAIPLEILNKKGPLSNLDWKLVKRHPEKGLTIMNDLGLLTNEAMAIVGQHHERIDGSGYPNGLHGKNIDMYSQVCAVADCFDGLTSKRPYRKEYSTFNAMKIMKHEVFKDFPPLFFSTFIKMLSKEPVAPQSVHV